MKAREFNYSEAMLRAYLLGQTYARKGYVGNPFLFLVPARQLPTGEVVDLANNFKFGRVDHGQQKAGGDIG